MAKRYLMTPGPTPVPSEVLLSQAQPIIHHRTKEFSKILAGVVENLKYIFQTKNEVLIFASSGTGAMESAIANLFSSGDKVVVAVNGKFGERFAEIANSYGLQVEVLNYPWNQVVNPNDIKAVLERDLNIKGVFVVQSETSSGVLNDVETIGKIVHQHPALLVVDSITGLGAVEVKTDDWHLDVVMTGSQKGLMLPPGLACVAVSQKAWQAVEKSNLPKYYFSYKKARAALKKNPPTTPFTPAVSLIIGLGRALDQMRQEGLENIIARHQQLAEATRRGLEAIGLKLFAPKEGRGNAVTPVWVPEGIDGKKLVNLLKTKYSITIAGGQADYAGRIFRIGHLGYFDKFDILTALAGLEMALLELGYDLKLGTAVKTAEEVFTSS